MLKLREKKFVLIFVVLTGFFFLSSGRIFLDKDCTHLHSRRTLNFLRLFGGPDKPEQLLLQLAYQSLMMIVVTKLSVDGG